MRCASRSNRFILEAFDQDLWCPVLQTRFQIDDIEALRTILGHDVAEDPELERCYELDTNQLAAIAARFGAILDHERLEADEPVIHLYRWHSIQLAPYLIHTRYELPLLLDGHKKLAKMSDLYPPMTFDGEERFDYWVAKGVLHRQEVIEPFERPAKGWHGHRTVYYTPKGEEWRIPAVQLVHEAAGQSGGWNEHFERIEGMLFGYEDWQNDWWIKTGRERGGGFYGMMFCCAVTTVGLAWIKAAGFRALPPTDRSTLTVASDWSGSGDPQAAAELYASMLTEPNSVAVVRFRLPGIVLRDFLKPERTGLFSVPAERIPELNRRLLDSVAIVAQREGAA